MGWHRHVMTSSFSAQKSILVDTRTGDIQKGAEEEEQAVAAISGGGDPREGRGVGGAEGKGSVGGVGQRGPALDFPMPSSGALTIGPVPSESSSSRDRKTSSPSISAPIGGDVVDEPGRQLSLSRQSRQVPAVSQISFQPLPAMVKQRGSATEGVDPSSIPVLWCSRKQMLTSVVSHKPLFGEAEPVLLRQQQWEQIIQQQEQEKQHQQQRRLRQKQLLQLKLREQQVQDEQQQQQQQQQQLHQEQQLQKQLIEQRQQLQQQQQQQQRHGRNLELRGEHHIHHPHHHLHPHHHSCRRHQRSHIAVVPNIVIEHVTPATPLSVYGGSEFFAAHALTPPFSVPASRWPSDGGGQKIRAYSDSSVYDIEKLGRPPPPTITVSSSSESTRFSFPTEDRPMSSSSSHSFSVQPGGSNDDRLMEDTGGDYQVSGEASFRSTGDYQSSSYRSSEYRSSYCQSGDYYPVRPGGDFQTNIYQSGENRTRGGDTMETDVEDLRKIFLSRTKTTSVEAAQFEQTSSCFKFPVSVDRDDLDERGRGGWREGGGELRPDNSSTLFWIRRHSDSNVTSDEAASGVSARGGLCTETSQTHRLLSSSDSMIDSDLPVVRDPLHRDDIKFVPTLTTSATSLSSVASVASVETTATTTAGSKIAAGADNCLSASEALFPGEPEKVGFMQKRQKLKKYLQTRYQTGLEELAAADAAAAAAAATSAADSDEVFVDRELMKSGSASDQMSSWTERSRSEVSPTATRLEMTRIEDDSGSEIYSRTTDLESFDVGSDLTMPRMLWHMSADQRPMSIDEAEIRPMSESRPMSFGGDLPLFRQKVNSETLTFTFPAVTHEKMTLSISSQNLSHRSLSPGAEIQGGSVRSLGLHIEGPCSVSTPPSPFILSPLGIRKYSSLGSSVQPSSLLAGAGVVGRAEDAALSPTAGYDGLNIRSTREILTTSEQFEANPFRGFDISLAAGAQQPTTAVTFEASRRRQVLSLTDYCLPPPHVLAGSSLISASAPPSPVAPHTPCSPSYPKLLPQSGPAIGGRGGSRGGGGGGGKSASQILFYPFSTTAKINEQRRTGSGRAGMGGGTDPKSFVCPVCSLELTSYNSLANHMVSHLPSEVISVGGGAGGGGDGSGGSGEGTHIHLCKVCNRSFSRSDMLARHMRLHTGLRPYECDLCGQVFSRSDHLHTHQRTHTGEKPYRCMQCVYAAPRRDMVTRHMRVHTRGDSGPSYRGRRSHSASSYRSDNLPGGAGPDDPSHPRALSSSSSSCGRGRKHKSVLLRTSLSSTPHERSRNWSVTSSATSTEGSEPSPGGTFSPRGGGRGGSATSRTWSTTSAESSEPYPSPGYTGSLIVWSPPVTDSPDVFTSSTRQAKHFVWPSVVVTTEHGGTEELRQEMRYPEGVQEGQQKVDEGCERGLFEQNLVDGK